MSKFDKVVGIFVITGVAIEIVNFLSPQIPALLKIQVMIPSEVRGAILAYLLLGTVILVIRRIPRIGGILGGKKMDIDPRFAHLTIHYSQRADTPDTPTPARPRYVTNNRTRQAYWVSDLTEPFIKQHCIQWHSHDSESALKAYFRKNKIGVNERDPTPKELELEYQRIKFYASRRELPPLETFLSQAKQEVCFLGVSLEETVRQNADAIRHSLEGGVSMKFLLLNPKSVLVGKVDEAMFPATEKAITTSLTTLCRIKSELAKLERHRCEIRIYDLLPFSSITVLDPNTDDAKILVESYLYKAGAETRTSIVISKSEDEALFNKYWNSCRFALEKSEEFQC